MKREFIFLLASLMLVGLLGAASMSLEAGTWTQKADMPTARYYAGSAVVDGKIYVIGGRDQVTLHAVEEYNPATDTWRRRTGLPSRRYQLAVAAVDGIIYAIGGWGEGRDQSTVQAYDPATDTWITKTNMPTARSRSVIAVVDGIIYVIGGQSGIRNIEVLSTVEAYDPATDTWTRKADMPTVRYAHAACVIDGRIYVFGGSPIYGSVICLSPVEVYDPATDTWTQVSDMPTAKVGHTASAVAGKIYIIGGADDSEPLDIMLEQTKIVDVYDPATDTWTTATNRLTIIGGHTAAVVDGRIYTIGGTAAPPPVPALSTVDEFDPGFPGVSPSVSPAGKLSETWGQIRKVQ